MEMHALYSPFTTFCEGPANIEKGYKLSTLFHKHNFLRRLPEDKNARILVVSSGVGYFQHSLRQFGYTNVIGVDSDQVKVEYAKAKGFDSMCANCFEFLAGKFEVFDCIFTEQEVNHLKRDEFIEFLSLARKALKQGGRIIITASNSANPFISTEYLGNNIDHYISIAENGLVQYLDLAGLKDIRVFKHNFYVLWHNPLNYVALAVTGCIHLFLRILFVIYGKKNKIFTKRLGAVAFKK
jgi:SAM-dependent methyltransferase